MPKEPHSYYDVQQSEEEYRRRQAVKAKRRKKRQMQRALLLGAMGLAAIIIVLLPIMLFTNCGSCGGAAPSSSSSSSQSVPAPVSTAPSYNFPVAADPEVWNLKLVNFNHQLPDQFSMPVGGEDGQIAALLVRDGVPVPSGGNDHYYFDNRIIDPLTQMINDCNAVEGHSLRILSGYRGWDTQATRYQKAFQDLIAQGMTQEEATLMVNRVEPGPGANEHQIGLAVDFGTGTLQSQSVDFVHTAEFTWLTENAANYGFILRYSSEKAAITGVDVQPYHWRYVGADDAHQIAGAGICLEEYLLQFPEGYDPHAAASPAVPATDPATDPASLPPSSGTDDE